MAGYLAAERDLGRLAAGSDIATLAPALIGAAHLLFSEAEGIGPDAAAVGATVATVLAGARPLTDPRLRRDGSVAPASWHQSWSAGIASS